MLDTPTDVRQKMAQGEYLPQFAMLDTQVSESVLQQCRETTTRKEGVRS